MSFHLRAITPVFIASSIIAVAIFIFTSSAPKSTLSHNSCSTDDLSGLIDFNVAMAQFEGNDIRIPSTVLAETKADPNVLGSMADINERWIEVDLSEQKLRAWNGNELYFETLVATGLPHTPTPTGEFRIWIKLRATKMEGGEGRYYYYLPNVPYVMFLENEQVPRYKGYGLHGTYWHNSFGTPRSHGCVNLPTEMAEKLYHWTAPVLPEGKSMVRSSEDNMGTRVIIHE